MTRFSTVRIFTTCVLVAVGMCALTSCQPPAATTGEGAAPSSSIAPRTDTRAANSPVRDLRRDEAAGGHILRKHVGQTEQQLRERLERELNITGASTYTDLPTAEHAVGTVIAQSQGEIQNWLNRQGRHPNLVLDYDSPNPIGRTMNRGEHQSRICEHAVVVLKYREPETYYVLTSYPECR
jgi:Bacterial CdiA-CT RNAse A domain